MTGHYARQDWQGQLHAIGNQNNTNDNDESPNAETQLKILEATNHRRASHCIQNTHNVGPSGRIRNNQKNSKSNGTPILHSKFIANVMNISLHLNIQLVFINVYMDYTVVLVVFMAECVFTIPVQALSTLRTNTFRATRVKIWNIPRYRYPTQLSTNTGYQEC